MHEPIKLQEYLENNYPEVVRLLSSRLPFFYKTEVLNEKKLSLFSSEPKIIRAVRKDDVPYIKYHDQGFLEYLKDLKVITDKEINYYLTNLQKQYKHLKAFITTNYNNSFKSESNVVAVSKDVDINDILHALAMSYFWCGYLLWNSGAEVIFNKIIYGENQFNFTEAVIEGYLRLVKSIWFSEEKVVTFIKKTLEVNKTLNRDFINGCNYTREKLLRFAYTLANEIDMTTPTGEIARQIIVKHITKRLLELKIVKKENRIASLLSLSQISSNELSIFQEEREKTIKELTQEIAECKKQLKILQLYDKKSIKNQIKNFIQMEIQNQINPDCSHCENFGACDYLCSMFIKDEELRKKTECFNCPHENKCFEFQMQQNKDKDCPYFVASEFSCSQNYQKISFLVNKYNITDL
ncbi:hypothetical protein [Thermodesulfovibrio sp. TK110]